MNQKDMALLHEEVETIRVDGKSRLEGFIKEKKIILGGSIVSVEMRVVIEERPLIKFSSHLELRVGGRIYTRRTKRILKGADWENILGLPWRESHKKVLLYLFNNENQPTTINELAKRGLSCTYSDLYYFNYVFRSFELSALKYRLYHIEQPKGVYFTTENHPFKLFIVENRPRKILLEIASVQVAQAE